MIEEDRRMEERVSKQRVRDPAQWRRRVEDTGRARSDGGSELTFSIKAAAMGW
jgi:hypothetical protein